MGRAPCCDKANVKKGPWSPEEDAKLKDYIEKQGTGGNWIALPRKAGLKRCGKSCRLRWLNYLRPNIKHGEFSVDEDRIIYTLFANIGSRWSVIAAHLPGRTDNDIKNYWNTKLKKKLMRNYHIGGPPGNIPARHCMPSSTLEQRDLFSAFSPSIPAASIPSSSNSDVYKLSPLSSSSSSSFTIPQPQDHQTFLGPFTMYGHEAASCSSSDGSFGGDRDHIRRQLHLQHVPNSDLQGFSSSYYENDNLAGDQEIINYGSSSTTPLDYYGIEEIKQLISSTSSFNLAASNSNNDYCSHNSFLFDVDNSSISGSVADLATIADDGFLYY